MSKNLSKKFYEDMKTLESRYPRKTALLIPALHKAQEERGWLSEEVLEEVAKYIGIHSAQVYEVVSFYTMFNLKPVGRHHIKLCTNVSCSLRGAEKLLHHCEKKLGIRCGETTKDGKFTLNEDECLGACGSAPAMMLNDEYHENMSPRKIDELLDSLE